MSSIFISYSRKELAIAEKIVSALAESQLDTWIDWKSIPKGEKFEKEIYKGIEGANVFLFLISPESVRSEWCKKEVVHATINNKRIIPLLIQDTHKDTISLGVSERNWIDCREKLDDFSLAIDEILKTIHTDYEWLRFHTSLQLKALEWERNDYENGYLLHDKELEDSERIFIANLGKEPLPTELQSQFISKSRIAENLEIDERRKTNIRLRNRAIIISGISLLAVVAIILTLWFGGRVGISTLNEQRQRQIALANQLSAQAQSIYIAGDSRQELSALLAIQSMKIYPSVQASQVLINNSLAVPIINIAPNLHNGKTDIVVAFSRDGKYFITQSDGVDHVWDLITGREVSNFDDNTNLEFVRFTSDSKHIISVSGRTIYISDVITGGGTMPITLDNNLNNNIDAVDVTSDGAYIVSVADRTAYIWEVSSKKVIAQKSSDLGKISAVAFSPDGKYIAYASDYIISIWNATTGIEIANMKRDNPRDHESITHLEFSPNGKLILSSSFDYGKNSIVRIWDAIKYKEIVSMIHNGLVESARFSPNSKYVVTACSDHIARVWELSTGKVISQMLHDGNVTSVAFSPDSKYVISGSEDNTARVWELASGKETARMTHNDDVLFVAFSPNGKYVGSGSLDNTARVWEPIVKNEISNMSIYGDIDSAVISPDQKYVAARSVSDHIFHVWEVMSGKETSQFTHEENIAAIAISPNNKYVVFGGWDGNGSDGWYGTVIVRDITTGKEISRMIHQLPNPGYPEATVRSVAFSPDSRYVVSGGYDQTARVWDVVTGKEISRMTYDDFDDKVTSVAFSPDGKYVVSGTDNFGTAAVRVWEANTGKEITRMYANAQSIVFSPDGRYIAIAGNGAWSLEQSVSLWDVATGKVIAYMNHNDNVSLVIFSPDGKFIASGSDDNTARIWNISTGEEVSRMTHDGKVNSIAFSPDGRYLVSGSDDRTARVWEAATGREIARVNHNDSVNLVNFSQDGKYVLSGSIGKLQTWTWRPEDLIAKACSRVTRNLTQDEWKQYVGNAMSFQPVCPNLLLETEIIPSVRLIDLIEEFYRK